MNQVKTVSPFHIPSLTLEKAYAWFQDRVLTVHISSGMFTEIM